jgi:hypothetical protein
MKPTIDPETFETNVPGIYLAGVVMAGRDTGKDLHRERTFPRHPDRRRLSPVSSAAEPIRLICQP